MFSFRENKILETRIDDVTRLRIKRIGFAVARVFFIDDHGEETVVPAGFSIMDHTNGDVPVHKFPGRQEYFLGWTDHYSMYVKERMVLTLTNQRQWEIQVPSDRFFTLLDE